MTEQNPSRIRTRLMMHANSYDVRVGNVQAVNRDRLACLPPPEVLGPRHRPIPHIELVETLEKSLNSLGVSVAEESFILGCKDRRIVGVFALDMDDQTEVFDQDGTPIVNDGQGLSLAFIGDNTKQISLRIYGGQITFVCDNLAVCGATHKAFRKHTTGLSLRQHVDALLDGFLGGQRDFSRKIAAAQVTPVSDDDARILICKAIEEDVIPGSAASKVCKAFFTEANPDTEGRTLWALYGAFTRSLREVPLATRVNRSAALNEHLFGNVPLIGTSQEPLAVFEDDEDDDPMHDDLY